MRAAVLTVAAVAGAGGTLAGCTSTPPPSRDSVAVILGHDRCSRCSGAGYSVSLVSADGVVVAHAHAVIGTRYLPNCSDCSWPPALPLAAVSDDRVYFRDGDTDVRWLSVDGGTGLAVRLPDSATSLSSFTVTADDRLIAVTSLDKLSDGRAHERTVIEDVGGGGHSTEVAGHDVCLPAFMSATTCTGPGIEVPMGWSRGSLILASSTGYRYIAAGGATAGPLSCRTAGALAGELLGATTATGPLCLASAVPTSAVDLLRWDGGATSLRLPALPCGAWGGVATSPDAQHIAAVETAGGSSPGCGDSHIVIGDAAGHIGPTEVAGTPLLWIDDVHLLFAPPGPPGVPPGSTGRLAILETGTGRVRSTAPVTADAVAWIPNQAAGRAAVWTGGAAAGATPAPARAGGAVLCTFLPVENGLSRCAPTGRAPYSFRVSAGLDGSLWYLGGGGDVAGALSVAGAGMLVVRGVRVPGSVPPVARGSDGSMWFTEPESDRVGRIASDGTVTEFRVLPQDPGTGTLPLRPSGITGGPGGAMWFTEERGAVGLVTADGRITQFTIPDGNLTTDPIGVDADGAFWVLHGDAVGRMSPSGGYREWPLPGGAEPVSLAMAPDGGVWVARGPADLVRVSSTGTMTVLPAPRTGVEISGLTPGRDGAMWFNEFDQRGPDQGTWWIARVGVDGRTTEYPMPAVQGRPIGLAVAADGALWVSSTSWIGRYVPPTATGSGR